MRKDKIEKLAELVGQLGGSRKAEAAIKSVRGAAPGKSSIYRATRGSSTDYTITCMIDDINSYLSANK